MSGGARRIARQLRHTSPETDTVVLRLPRV